jgi:uncharacterized protein (DUF1015 family)
MAEIHPFRALRYDTNKVKLDDVLTQPYDKITPAMQERYYGASPYNLIAIEKGKPFPDDTPENNVYKRGERKLQEWITQKILVADQTPAIYVYSQEYMVPGTNSRKVRIGFLALGRLEDYSAKIVFPHERTLTAPKADRMELLRCLQVQTGQLFMLYDDRARTIDIYLEEIARTPTQLELHDEFGVTHRLWPVDDAAFIRRMQSTMADKKIIIADGHHRYETALNFRNECRAKLGKTDRQAAYEFAMMTFINWHSRGLTILPTHRLIGNVANFDFERFRKALGPFFDWYSYPFLNAEERETSYADFRKDLGRQNHGRRAIGVYPGKIEGQAGAFFLFLLRRDANLETLLPDLIEAQRGLDVVLLHRLMMEKGLGITAEAVTAEKNVVYERDIDNAIAAVDRGEAQLACLLNPVRVQQVVEIALSEHVLPQKSTDFYPKLLSGLAIYQVEGQIEQ